METFILGLLNQQVDVFTTDIDEFARQVHIERLEYLWRGRVKQSQQADDWFHEGKELGKSILRGVSGRTVIWSFQVYQSVTESNF